jgi:hypothetical protein
MPADAPEHQSAQRGHVGHGARRASATARAPGGEARNAGPASSGPAGAQARRLRAKIARDDPGRIRIAATVPSALRRGG